MAITWLPGGPGSVSVTSDTAVNITGSGGAATTARKIFDTVPGRTYRLNWSTNSSTGTYQIGQSALRWNPPPLASDAITINLNDSANATKTSYGPYGSDVDILIIPKTTNYTLERLQITGGRNIRLIGGYFRSTTTVTAAVLNFVHCYGSVWLEGVHVEMNGVGERDAINFMSVPEVSAPNASPPSPLTRRPDGTPGASIYMQNVRVTNVKGTFNGIHGDVFQPQGDVNELLTYKMTCSTTYQAFLLEQRLGRADRDDHIIMGELEKISATRLSGGDASSKLFYFCETTTPQFPLNLKDVYIDVPDNNTLPVVTYYTHPPEASAVGTRRSGNRLTWSRIGGFMTVGAGPDYAPANATGLNYSRFEPVIKSNNTSFVNGTNTYEFTAANDKTYVEFQRTSTGTVNITNISLAEVGAVNRIDPVAWETVGTGTSITDGVITIAATGSTTQARQGIATVVGSTYRLTWTVAGLCAYNLIGNSATTSEIKGLTTCDGAGDYVQEFVAQATTTWIRFQRSTSGTSTISNIMLTGEAPVVVDPPPPDPVADPNTIVIMLAQDPGQAVDVYYQWGKFDNANPVFDNTAPLGLDIGKALLPLMTPVQSPAENVTSTVNALKFNDVDTFVRYTDTPNWTFPNADWTVGVWARIDDPTGGTSQYMVSNAGYGAVNSFNFFIYESGSTTAQIGALEVSLRDGVNATITVKGPATSNLLDNSWRLFTIERVKATETCNIYYTPVNGTRVLYHSASVSGLGVIDSGLGVAYGTRVQPTAGNARWLNGAMYEVFKMDGLLSKAETELLAAGRDINTDLGKTTTIHAKLNTLTSPIPDAGGGNSPATLNGPFILTAGPSFKPLQSAVRFNGVDTRYTFADSNSFNMPDTDWTFGAIFANTDISGTVGQYIHSNGNYQSTNSFNFLMWESESASTPKSLGVAVRGGTLGSYQVIGPAFDAINDGQFRLWTVERVKATGTLNIYYTPINGSRVLYHTSAVANLTAVEPPGGAAGVPTIGTRAVTNVDRWFVGDMFMQFQINGRLTQSQTESIAAGVDLVTGLSLSPSWYVKLTDTTATVADLSGNGNTATLNGTAVKVSGPTFNS